MRKGQCMSLFLSIRFAEGIRTGRSEASLSLNFSATMKNAEKDLFVFSRHRSRYDETGETIKCVPWAVPKMFPR